MVFLALALVPRLALAADAWNVGDVGRPGQLTIYGRSPEGSLRGLPLAIGDFNGDGRADVIITPMNADSGPNRDRQRAGEAIVLFSAGTIGGEIDLLALNDGALPASATVIYGAKANDFLGTEVFTGDVNGDGFDDAIIGAQYGDGPDNRLNCGEVVMFWGGPSVGGRRIDLAALEPDDPITLIFGATGSNRVDDSGERLGVWVGAGDFDGDHVADVLMGADQVNGPDGQRPHAGMTYVLYGSSALRALATIDLASTDLPLTRVHGIDPEDHSGSTVRAFDLNGDGVAELIIGAGLNRASAAVGPLGIAGTGHGSAGGDGPDNSTPQAGEAYILYGQMGVRPDVIDLRAPPPSTVFIYGVDSRDAYGEELYAGDFNGDRFGDVVIGALTGDGPGNARPDAGEAALILGSADLPGSTILLATQPPKVTFFYGASQRAIAGDTVLMADLDADGKDELIIGSPMAAPGGRVNAGTVSVFFGTDAQLPTEIDLAAPPVGFEPFVIEGGSDGDILMYSGSRGDVDGDGFTDLALNGMGADGFNDQIDFAGDVYVLSGFEVSQAAGRVTASPTPTPTNTTTPTITPTTTSTPLPCAADCDGNRKVTTDELIRGVRIALGSMPVGDCLAVDFDHNQMVSVDELVMGVAAALHGCSS